MPRMAAFFGSIALMAGAIGLNMLRYPMVWEMVGTSADFSPASQPAPSTAAVQPEPVSQPITAAESAASKKPAQANPSAQQKDGVPRKDAADGASGASGNREPGKTARAAKPKGKKPPPAMHDSAAAHEKQPSVTAAALQREKASPEKERQSHQAEASPGAGGQLVPVVYPPGAQTEDAPPPELPAGMCRLPPLDQVAPARPGHLPPSASGQPPAMYPSTGI